MTTGHAIGPRRGRGERAGLDAARIVAAARRLDPESLTMRALADELGVDRKAINHHVVNREALLELVAADAVASRLGPVAADAALPWQDVVRTFATSLSESLIASGTLALHFPLSALAGMHATELVLGRLVDAGFDAETAGRCLHMAARIALSHARDLARHHEGHALGHAHEEGAAEIFAAEGDLSGDALFRFYLDITVAGFERRLERA